MHHSSQHVSLEFLAGRHVLMTFIAGLVRDPNVAEDIFQEVWIRLTGAISRGTEVREVAKWCRGVAKNLILHHWRQERAMKGIIDGEIIELVGMACAEQDAASEEWRLRGLALEECLRKLPEKSRELLRLKYERGLSFLELAQRFQKSAASLMMTVSRLRRTLLECIRNLTREEGFSA